MAVALPADAPLVLGQAHVEIAADRRHGQNTPRMI